MLQRHPFQMLHHNEGSAVLFADVVNGANVGMIERRSRSRLSLETCQRLRVPREVVRQKLQRHPPMQPDVLGPVNDAHAAAAELLDNAVVTQFGIDEQIIGQWIAVVSSSMLFSCQAMRGYLESGIIEEGSSL